MIFLHIFVLRSADWELTQSPEMYKNPACHSVVFWEVTADTQNTIYFMQLSYCSAECPYAKHLYSECQLADCRCKAESHFAKCHYD
jgi:hypothetical protein